MKTRDYRLLIAGLVVLYIGLTLLPAPARSSLLQYHISSAKARVVSVSVILPVVAIWLVAVYGFTQVREYALLIKDSKDGAAMHTISTGLLCLALGPPAAAVIAAIFNILLRHFPGWLAATTIINNYLSLLIMVAGLFFIARGAEQLADLVRKKPSQTEQRNLILLFITLSTFYGYFIVTQPIHNAMPHRLYFMPNVLVLLTLAIPYLYFWYRGLMGAYYLRHYQKHIKGAVYRDSLGYMASGIALVIVSSVVIRFVATISAKIITLRLTPLLLIVYGLLLLSALGYIAIAIGAKKLHKIEVV